MMNSPRSLAIGLASLGSAAFASDAIVASDRHLGLGIVVSDFYYVEHNDDDPSVPTSYLDKEFGTLRGLRLGASTVLPTAGDLYASLTFSRITGLVRYKGYLLATMTPIDSHSGEAVNAVDGRIGRLFPLAPDWTVTPFAEVGWRHWVRHVGEGDSGVYTETYEHFELGPGLLAQFAASPDIILSLSAMVGTTLSPQIEVPEFDFNAALGTSWCYHLQSEADFRLSGAWHAVIGIAYGGFEYRKSDVSNSSLGPVFEPRSTTSQLDGSVGIRLTY